MKQLIAEYAKKGYTVEITPGLLAGSNYLSTFDGYLVSIANQKGDTLVLKISANVPREDFKELIDATITGTGI